MRTPRSAARSAWIDYTLTAERDLNTARKALETFSRIEYKTKKNGTPYKDARKNFPQECPVRIRGQFLEIVTPHRIYAYFLTDFETIRRKIENTRENIEKEITVLETAAHIKFDQFLEEATQ